MTIQDWGAVGELIGAAGVAMTLIYLAVQLRQNTHSVRAATHHSIADAMSEVYSLLVDESVAALYLNAIDDWRAVSTRDRIRLTSLMLRVIKVFEDAYFQWREGNFDERAWQSNHSWFLDVLSQQPARSIYESRKRWFSQEFTQYADGQMADHEPVVVLDSWVAES